MASSLTHSDVRDIYLEQVEKFFDDNTVNVFMPSSSNDMRVRVEIRGTIDGERFGADRSLSDNLLYSGSSDAIDIIEMDAENLRRSIENRFTEKLVYDRVAIQVNWLDNEIECLRCGARASDGGIGDNVDESSVKYRMAMLALLRGECDSLCENARHTGMYR